MKLQIDIKAKTIKVDETVKFEDLIKVLNKLLPKEWKSYSLETNCLIYAWTNPIPYYPYITQPWRIGDVTYKVGDPLPPEPITTCYNIEVMN